MSLTTNAISRIKPIYDYLKAQQENEKALKTMEIGATFVLITFFVIFAIRPTVLTISSLVGEIKSKQLLKTKLNQKINDVIVAQDLFSQVEGRYDVVNSSLPDHPSFYDSYNQIRYSIDSNISIKSLSFEVNSVKQSSAPTTNLKTYSTSVNAIGPFTNSISLMEKLLNNQRLINVSSISFRNVDTNTPSASPSAIASGGISTNFKVTFNYWPTTNE